MEINYVKGDATRPIGEGKKIICHICNDVGAWGAGFVLAVSKRWDYPEQFYRARQKYPLGRVDVLKVEEDMYVANMIAQHNIRPDGDGTPPIRYIAVADALHDLNKIAVELGASIHMPRIGCGLAGGEWSTIEIIIKQFVTVPVTVYDLP